MTGIETLRAQLHWLASAMAASMLFMFSAAAIPWALRMIDIDIQPLAWTLTGFATAHAVILVTADHVASRVTILRLLHAVPLVGAASMTLLWHYSGGLAHPSLALAMALPVIGASALPRPRFAFDVAAYSALTTTIGVAITSADFGWYLTQLVPAAGSIGLAGQEIAGREPFPGATTTPAAAFLFVATFIAVQFAVAVTATRVAASIRQRHDVNARGVGDDAESLASISLHAVPAAAVTLVASTSQIVAATKRFTQQMYLHNTPVVGRELFDVLTFVAPAEIRAAIERGGIVPLCRYRIGAEERVASIAAERFTHAGVAYANLVVTDWNDIAWLATAAEAVTEPLFVVGGDARIRYANRAAREIFDNLYAGREITPLLGDWWSRQGASPHRLEVGTRLFQGTATPVRLFGSDPGSLVTLREENP